MAIRPGTDVDSAGAIALLARCFADYPGCILDVEREEPGMLAPASHFAGRGGRFWVAEADGAVAGMAAAVPSDAGRWQVCKVYVHPDHHGSGLGQRLLDTAEGHALAAGAAGLHLWTDTRFDRAHRFYEKRGYVRAGPIRALGDISSSLEFHYAKPVDGVMPLDAAGAASAVRTLAGVLATCVDGDASAGPGLGLDAARAHMQAAARGVATGAGALLAGWSGGVLAGTVRVHLDRPANQAHRADVAGLLVHPAHRRRGVGTALMRAAEDTARQAGCRLLVLDAVAGGAAERLLVRLGWIEAGRIPGAVLDDAGRPVALATFYKAIEGCAGPGRAG